jgi:hypothetical protein
MRRRRACALPVCRDAHTHTHTHTTAAGFFLCFSLSRRPRESGGGGGRLAPPATPAPLGAPSKKKRTPQDDAPRARARPPRAGWGERAPRSGRCLASPAAAIFVLAVIQPRVKSKQQQSDREQRPFLRRGRERRRRGRTAAKGARPRALKPARAPSSFHNTTHSTCNAAPHSSLPRSPREHRPPASLSLSLSPRAAERALSLPRAVALTRPRWPPSTS